MKYTEIDSWVQSIDIAGEAAKKTKKKFFMAVPLGGGVGGLIAVPLRYFFNCFFSDCH